MIDVEACDLAITLKGCSSMMILAQAAVDHSQAATVTGEAEAWSELHPISICDTVQVSSSVGTPLKQSTNKIQGLLRLLESTVHPMYVAQGLMSNLAPASVVQAVRALSSILLVPWPENSPYGPFAPRCLQPETYGVRFDGIGPF